MSKQCKRYKLKLNSADKIEELLQEMYDEACENINSVQEQMNKLTSSVSLNEEVMDAKCKYGKTINDFLTNKNKAIGTKLDIAKLMTEILKFNGNIEKASQEGDIGNFDDFIAKLHNTQKEEPKIKEYNVN